MRTGDWIATSSGRQWFITDPHPEDVEIADIAHALSMICRFGGHCRSFYSVAQHCVIIANDLARREAPVETALWGLLHDAPEAYLGDMVRPLKNSMPAYKAVEHLTEERIMAGLGLPMPDAATRAYVKHLDDVALMTERRDLMNHCGHDWSPRAEPLPEIIVPLSPEEARAQFLTTYDGLRNLLLAERTHD